MKNKKSFDFKIIEPSIKEIIDILNKKPKVFEYKFHDEVFEIEFILPYIFFSIFSLFGYFILIIITKDNYPHGILNLTTFSILPIVILVQVLLIKPVLYSNRKIRIIFNEEKIIYYINNALFSKLSFLFKNTLNFRDIELQFNDISYFYLKKRRISTQLGAYTKNNKKLIFGYSPNVKFCIKFTNMLNIYLSAIKQKRL